MKFICTELTSYKIHTLISYPKNIFRFIWPVHVHLKTDKVDLKKKQPWFLFFSYFFNPLENVVECYKQFFGYFNALKTHGESFITTELEVSSFMDGPLSGNSCTYNFKVLLYNIHTQKSAYILTISLWSPSRFWAGAKIPECCRWGKSIVALHSVNCEVFRNSYIQAGKVMNTKYCKQQ
jgi:hypothetical protein